MSAADDPRLPGVKLAVEFWNDALLNLGSSFRLGLVTVIPEQIPYKDIFRSQYSWTSFDPRYSESFKDVVNLRIRLDKVSGDVIIFLADGD